MLQVAKALLPDSLSERHGILRTYFCDKDAVATPSEDGWNLDLHWPDGLDRHVDPRLDIGLAWWGENVTRSTMVYANRRQHKTLLSLYDTWTLYSWSEWLSRLGGLPPEEITILHVDDHRDLGTPRLLTQKNGFLDLITGRPFELANPESVMAALDSGAVGMGSFMTPFLHAAPTACIRHLCQPPKAVATRDSRIQIVTELDDLLQPGSRRPAISLSDSVDSPLGHGTYRVTTNPSEWLADVGGGPVILHIDMDYFNNRYDGNSGWQEQTNSLDPDANAIHGKIDELSTALRDTKVLDRIADITVSFSPGFFPAEYWASSCERLLKGLGETP